MLASSLDKRWKPMGGIGLLVFIVALPVSLIRSHKKLATLMIALATFVASVVLFAGVAILNGMAPVSAVAIAWVFGLFCASLASLIHSRRSRVPTGWRSGTLPPV
jgi:hypothetical protein